MSAAPQASLVFLVARHGRMGIIPKTPEEKRHAARARRAGLIQPSGYETSVAADDWLDSRSGQESFADAERQRREGEPA